MLDSPPAQRVLNTFSGATAADVVDPTISAFARLDQMLVEAGMAQLERDLASGVWHERHADLMTRESIDAGLRLVVAGPTPRYDVDARLRPGACLEPGRGWG